jgi:hypothetical protein
MTRFGAQTTNFTNCTKTDRQFVEFVQFVVPSGGDG